jgi:hypothetical protein
MVFWCTVGKWSEIFKAMISQAGKSEWNYVLFSMHPLVYETILIRLMTHISPVDVDVTSASTKISKCDCHNIIEHYTIIAKKLKAKQKKKTLSHGNS